MHPDTAIDERFASLRGMRVCVTGGAGFIGGHLTEALLAIGAEVVVIDDLSNADAGLICQLAAEHAAHLRFVHGSILEPAALHAAVEGASVVFHLAAMSSVPRSLAEPERVYAVNLTGTVRVLEAARRGGATRVVYSASSSAYGDTPALPKREDAVPSPLSPYAASKLAGEHAVAAHAHSFGLSGVCLRYFNVFGPRQPADTPYAGVIAAFAKAVLGGEAPVVYGDGGATRDFTYVANVVEANLLAAVSNASLEGQPVNVGAGERVSIADLAREIAQHLGHPDLQPSFQPARAGDVLHSQASLDRAEMLLGYTPRYRFAEGIGPTLAWYRARYATAQPR